MCFVCGTENEKQLYQSSNETSQFFHKNAAFLELDLVLLIWERRAYVCLLFSVSQIKTNMAPKNFRAVSKIQYSKLQPRMGGGSKF